MNARAATCLAGLALLCACAAPPRAPLESASDGRVSMGTVLEIALYAPEGVDTAAALEALFAVARRLDALLTVYAPESALSRLNRTAAESPQTVDPEFAAVLEHSLGYAELTGGAFDVTVGPLVELWTQAAKRGAPPSARELALARALVGRDRVQIFADGRVGFDRAGVSVNLGAIAKGYALDRMLPRLAEQNVERALLSFGQSSTWAVGAPPDAPGWRLLVRGPGGGFVGAVTLKDQALSVSGSLAQFVEIGGRRYGHVVDPRSGLPIRHRRQALVVAGDATLAEALSTGLLVLGERDGLALVEEQPGCEGLLLDAEGGTWMTSGWQRAVRYETVREMVEP